MIARFHAYCAQAVSVQTPTVPERYVLPMQVSVSLDLVGGLNLILVCSNYRATYHVKRCKVQRVLILSEF